MDDGTDQRDGGVFCFIKGRNGQSLTLPLVNLQPMADILFPHMREPRTGDQARTSTMVPVRRAPASRLKRAPAQIPRGTVRWSELSEIQTAPRPELVECGSAVRKRHSKHRIQFPCNWGTPVGPPTCGWRCFLVTCAAAGGPPLSVQQGDRQTCGLAPTKTGHRRGRDATGVS